MHQNNPAVDYAPLIHPTGSPKAVPVGWALAHRFRCWWAKAHPTKLIRHRAAEGIIALMHVRGLSGRSGLSCGNDPVLW